MMLVIGGEGHFWSFKNFKDVHLCYRLCSMFALHDYCTLLAACQLRVSAFRTRSKRESKHYFWALIAGYLGPIS